MFIQERERDEVAPARLSRRRQRQEQGRHVPPLQKVFHGEEHWQALGRLLRAGTGKFGSLAEMARFSEPVPILEPVPEPQNQNRTGSEPVPKESS